MNIQISPLKVKPFFSVKAVFFFILLFSSNKTFADFQTTTTLSLGGAGHASPLLTDAIYVNPAFLATTPITAGSVSYQKSQAYDFSAPQIAVLDGSQDALFQAGIAGARMSFADTVHIAAAKKLGKKISAGIGSKLYFMKVPTFSRQLDFYASVAFSPNKYLLFSAMLDNIRQSIPGLDLQRTLVLGSKICIGDNFALYADPQINLASEDHKHFTEAFKKSWLSGLGKFSSELVTGYAVAAEIVTFGDVLLRGGLFRNTYQATLQEHASGWGIGAGWIGPRIALHLASHYITNPQKVSTFSGQVSIFF